MDALFASMQQIQTMQVQQIRDKSAGSHAPEAVKPGTTTLPIWTAPDPSSGSLDFQDWLELVAGLMGDLSDTSHVWWSPVFQASRDAYERWLKATPLDRIRVEPDDRSELVKGKWSRVNAKACAMILSALDPGVKAEMVARRTTQVAPSHVPIAHVVPVRRFCRESMGVEPPAKRRRGDSGCRLRCVRT